MYLIVHLVYTTVKVGITDDELFEILKQDLFHGKLISQQFSVELMAPLSKEILSIVAEKGIIQPPYYILESIGNNDEKKKERIKEVIDKLVDENVLCC